MALPWSRRNFIQLLGALSVTAGLRAETSPARPPARRFDATGTINRKNLVATQVKAYAWKDEGIDQLLDNLQSKGNVNTVFAFTFLTGSGRIVEGGPIELPDHGKYGVPDVGGAFYDADSKYFLNTTLKGGHSPDPFNVIAEVAPKIKARGMDFFAWDYNNSSPLMSRIFPDFADVCEVDVYGRRTDSACWNHPNYRAQLRGRIESYLIQYSEQVAGVIWGCERMGPLDNLIGGGWTTKGISCFCLFCRAKAKERGISVERAKEGYVALDALLDRAKRHERPADGFFVTYFRTLLQYPEILAWHNLWNDSYQEVRAELYGTAKTLAPQKPFGLHMVQNITFSPFYSAVDDYSRLANYADFAKIATYSNAGGGRMAGFINHLCDSVFADTTPQKLTPIYYKLMGYDEKPFDELGKNGLSPAYIQHEVKRAIANSQHKLQVYASVDIDTPVVPGAVKSNPERVAAEVKGALSAGADGIVLSREYTEMRLANLAAAGDASRAFFAHRASAQKQENTGENA